MKKEERLLSLDTLRGFDMFFIMGGGSLLLALASFLPEDCRAIVTEQMGHKEWNGLAFYDLIFPLFLFLAGVSFPFSMAKQLSAGKDKSEITLKIIRRGLLLVFFGVLYNGLLQFDFETLRYASVLGRIGLAWMFASLIYLWFGKKVALFLSAKILLLYWALLALIVAPDAPAGAGSFSMEGCIVGYIDRLLLPGQLHLEIHDPEGILSTLPAIVTALIGIFTGEFVRSEWGSGHKKSLVMLFAALSLLVVGYLWGMFFPLNKNLWTSSFELLTKVAVEYSTRGIEGMKLVLHIEGLENIVGVANGKMAGVGVVGCAAVLIGGSDDVGIEALVMLRKTVGGRLGRSSLKVVEVAVLLLVVRKTLTHVEKNLLCKLTGLGMCHILSQPLCIKAGLVHTNKSDGGEVIVEGAEITLGVGIQTLAEKLCDNITLYLKRARRKVKHMVEALVEVLLILCKICNSGHINGNNADRAGGLAGAEESAGLLTKLTEVKAQTAAHGTHVGGLHVGVDIV